MNRPPCTNCFKEGIFYVCNAVLLDIGGLPTRKRIAEREAFIGSGEKRINAEHVHCSNCYRVLDVKSHFKWFTTNVDMYFPDKNCEDFKTWTPEY
jgi:hypothetical protein